MTDTPRPSRAAVIALLLLLGLETTTRIAVSHGFIEPDYSLHRLTEQYLAKLRRDRPGTWLVGNSVAGRGLDAEIISRTGSAGAVVLAHGSASAAGSAAMMRYYLDRIPYTPREVAFFFSKDDFNRNGQRASVSLSYAEWAENGPPFDIDQWLALSAARGGIIDAVQLGAARLLLPFINPARRARAPVFDGKPIRADHPVYLDTLRNYEMDLDVVARLARFSRRRGIAVRFILMPVTDRYVEFHERVLPSLPYETIRARLAEACRRHEIPLFDHGEPSDKYHLFHDPYHLNEAGKKRASELFARELFSADDRGVFVLGVGF